MLDGLAATTWLFNTLNRRSYPLGAGCVDDLLIWGSVRRFRTVFEQIDHPPPPQQLNT